MRSIYHTFLLLLLYSASLSAQSDRLALIIGNNEYETADKLVNPVNDAQDIAAQLKLLGFEIIEIYDADQREMKKSIDEFGQKLQNAQIGLFYYSGHGIQVHGYNYLIPVNANLQSEDDAEYDCVNTGRILTRMENSGVNTSIIILDACRNNPFEDSWQSSLSNHGLAFMEAPTGSLIAYSTAPGRTASDGSGTNGLYTRYLLDYIADPEYNIIQVFQEVRKKVREESEGKQVPWESTSLEKDFFFNQTGSRVSIEKEEVAEEVSTSKSRKISERFDEIKSDPSNIWIVKEGPDVETADGSAKNELAERIMNHLYSKIGSGKLTKEKQAGVGLITSDLLFNSERRIVDEKRKKYVLRYLSAAEIDGQLSIHEMRAREYALAGQNALAKLRIADALRNYYWSYAQSEAFPGEIGITIDDADYKSLGNYVSGKIEEISANISVHVIDSSVFNDRVIYTLEFNYKEQLVQNIDFKYWNGDSWSARVIANNGHSMASMYPSKSLGDLKIKLEYSDESKTKFDPYLQQTINNVSRNFSRELAAGVKNAGYKKHHEIADDHLAVIDQVLEKIKQNESEYDEDLFTRDGYEVYKQLLVYGQAQFLSIGSSYTSFDFNGRSYVRSVPFTFAFRTNSVHFSENICFEIDQDNKISNVSFALSDMAIQDIMSMSRWPIESKLQIIHFLENYKTAYALKRLDYIEKIFSDNALIIVGKKLEVSKIPDQGKYFLTGNNYEFTQLTKEEYLYRLRKVFSRNEYINIQFEENVVKKRDNQSEVYGINIKQNYFSSSYADQGHLFLMVDVEDAGKPVIYVRSWQPEKFKDGHLIDLSDFSY